MVEVAGADITVQADLGSAPFILNRDHLNTDTLTPPDDAFDDVTCDVERASWTWGASQPLGPLTTITGGRGRFDLADPLRLFDPGNAASPLAPILHVGSPVRVLADGVPLWTGALESWSHDLGPSVSTLQAVDAWAELAGRTIPTGTAIAAGWSSSQLGKVLDAAGWPSSRRVFTGTPAAYRSAVTVDGSAAGVAASVRLAELGDLWADHDGRIALRGRGEPYAPAPAAIVNCGGALLASLETTFTRDRIRNVVELDGHSPPSYSDAASVRTHGPRAFGSSVADLALIDPPAGLRDVLGDVGVVAPRTLPSSLTATLSSAFGQVGGSNLGGGADQHLPVGAYGGNKFRSAVRFPALDWSGVASLTSAKLRLRTTTQVHLGFGSSPRIRARRITESWTPNSATNDGGGNWSSSGETYPGPAATSSGESVASIPTGEGATVDVDVTAIVRAWAPSSAGGAGAGQYGIELVPGTEGDTTDATEFYSAKYGTSSSRPQLILVAVTNRPPSAPAPIGPVGSNASLAAGFQATATDPDGDAIAAWNVELNTAAGALVWSVPTSSAGITGGTIAAPYTGPALTLGAAYTWRMRVQDAPGSWGPWCAPVAFTYGTAPPDRYVRWSSTILDELADPVPLTVLGTIRPTDDDVAAIIGAEYGDRLEVRDVHTSPAIDRIVRVLGMAVDLDPDGITATAITEDV